jgi:hypothetical protein
VTDNADADPSQGWGLVMPFVTVASNGGPHDDTAYAAGWEMGALNERLAHAHGDRVTATLRADSVAQADLIAMHAGYTLNPLRRVGDNQFWVYCEFRPVTASPSLDDAQL